MKTTCIAWLAVGLLLLPGCGLAQVASPTGPPPGAPTLLAPAGSQRPELGGPPRLPVANESNVPTGELAQLLQAVAGQPAEVARLFPQAVRQLPTFRADINALATVKALADGHLLLVLPPGTTGVPSGGAALGQRLKLLTSGGERLVTLVRPATAGSHTLMIRAEAGLAGQPVAALGLEHPAEAAIDYEALGQLHLRATQQLAQQLAALQQQADLHRQLAAARQLNGQLLLDHAALLDLQQQLSVLQNRQAASFLATPPRRLVSWPAD